MTASPPPSSPDMGHYREKLNSLGTKELQNILVKVGWFEFRAITKQHLVQRILILLLAESKTPDQDNVVTAIDEAFQCVCGVPIPAGTKTRPYYCELCRMSRADPFSVTFTENIPLPAVTLPYIPSYPQRIVTTFSLIGDRKEYDDVQAWCLLQNDDVPFRVHWPKHASLSVNGAAVKTAQRTRVTSLGPNDRDDGVSIAEFTKSGVNSITLTANDHRPFSFGVRLVWRRTVQEIMDLIPEESLGEKLADAVARVRRCIGGGDDVEAVSDHVPVSLRCPMSGSRIKVAGRFKPCVHMGCFDLEVFLEMNMRSKKWQCPVCLKKYCLDDVIIDPYFNRIATGLRNLGQGVNEVEVKTADGCWRAKSNDDYGGPLGELGLWHEPDGSLCDLPGSVTATDDRFGDAEVIDLDSDSEEDEDERLISELVARQKEPAFKMQQDSTVKACNLLISASLKRAREEGSESFPAKRPSSGSNMYTCINID